MTSYQKLILENQVVLEELDMECQEKINEDMAYALSYLSIYNNQLNVPKMHREMNNQMIIYGLSDMIYRGMTLVKFYAPNGVMLSEILNIQVPASSFYKKKSCLFLTPVVLPHLSYYNDCKNIGNLGNGEIEKMVTRLKYIDQKAVENHVNGAVWAFDYDKMFCVLMENEICRKVCEKNKYNS